MPHGEMTTSRLEAFSDGVIAIIVTIMVLELRAPSQPTLASSAESRAHLHQLRTQFPVVAIMWVNHHHLIHAVREVTARLLVVESESAVLDVSGSIRYRFFGKNYHEPMAVALYGLDLTLCGSAFYMLRIELVPPGSAGTEIIRDYHAGMQRKNAFSAGLYFLSVAVRLHLRLRLILYLCPDSGFVLPAGEKTGRIRTRVSRLWAAKDAQLQIAVRCDSPYSLSFR